ncbi:hypothetical protein [Niabella beijingensis]|uniref:hypothetical protein n=1 Tax=Niabella beijingensis TaxID=2872700 RepID=UPI001CBE614C|nr:hypothetical protein [Niabella beijingensis]MBZ4191757.1 hypothetical protein [Niabella beijingensis]
MDYKTILDTTADVLEALQSCIEQRQPVSLLYDDNGWERAEGKIRGLTRDNGADLLILENGITLEVTKIVAVNGAFRTGCSC